MFTQDRGDLEGPPHRAEKAGMDGHVHGSESVEFRISQRDMDAFRALSGDTNPLHQDIGFASRRGFVDKVVYGGLLVAQVSRLLGNEMPGRGCVWRSITLRFRGPLYVGEPARLTGTITHANSDLGLIDLSLKIETRGRAIAEGEASAILAKERLHG